jgi:hypothetical protein
MGVTGQFPFFLLRRREEGPLRIPEQPLPSRVHVVMARVTWTSMIGRHGAKGLTVTVLALREERLRATLLAKRACMFEGGWKAFLDPFAFSFCLPKIEDT